MHHGSLLNYFNLRSFVHEKIFGTFQKKANGSQWNSMLTRTDWHLLGEQWTADTKNDCSDTRRTWLLSTKRVNIETTKVDLQIQVYIENIAML